MEYSGFDREQQIAIAWDARHHERYLGGFAWKLVSAWYHADYGNRARLAKGFPYLNDALNILMKMPDIESKKALNDMIPNGE